MTTQELYLMVQDLVNQNSTNNKIALDKGRFVDLYNMFVPKYIKYELEKRNQSDIRHLSFLLQRKKLTEVFNTEKYNSYQHPSDYFEFSNIFPVFTGKGCKALPCQVATEVKTEEVDLYYSDEFKQPSLKAAETIYHTSAVGFDVYKKDFEIKEVELLYYREPVKIDIEGYEKIDGTMSTNIQTDLPLTILPDVALMLSKIFSGSKEEMNKYQVLNNELNTKK